MRAPIIAAALILSACQPAPPSPAMLKLNAACQRGDTAACSQIVRIEQQEAAATSAAYRRMASAPQTYQIVQPVTLQSTQQIRCRPDYLGGVICSRF